MSTFYANYPVSGSASGGGNPSVGPNGSPAPADSTEIGFINGSGNLTAVSPSTPLPVTIESEVGDLNVNIAEYGGVAVTLGQATEAASMPVVIASDQSAIPVSQSGTWNVGLNAGANTIGAISNTSFIATQTTGSNLHVDVDNFPATQPVSGTVAVTQSTSPWVDNITQFGSNPVVTGTGASGVGIPRVTVSNDSNILATQSGTWNITNITGTVSLPTGASTSALQSNVQSAPGTPQTQAVTVQGNASGVPIPVSGTVATTAPINSNATFTGSLSVTTTEGSTAAPANAVGVVFEAESSNAVNIRWGVSNSSGSILTTSSGVLMEPGRSIDYLPIGTGTFLHYIATAAGSNVIDIQWILSH